MQKPKKLLVVDDEDFVLRMLARFLRREGYEVYEAHSVDDAIRVYELSKPIDALLCDVWLNGDSGWSVAVQIRALQPSISVLMVSGRIDVDPPILGFKYAILSKPFSPKQLKTVLATLW